jgi:ParB family chromosome partitioning protein
LLPVDKKKGLGKGLSALIGAGTTAGNGGALHDITALSANGAKETLLHLDPRAIKPNPRQPRKEFDEETLQELADSIRRDGVQEPVIVRRSGIDYELVSGERRVRAAVMVDLDTIPAVCRDVSDRDMLKLGLIENIQREDLNPIDLAHAYHDLIQELSWTQEQLADEVGKKRVTVTNTLRLLNLPADIQAFVLEGALTMGHARALLAIDKPAAQRAAAQKIIREGLSVRQAEKLAGQKLDEPEPKKPRPPERKDPNIAVLEDDLRRRLGTKVSIRASKKNRGKIEIEFFNLDELDRILAIISSETGG